MKPIPLRVFILGLIWSIVSAMLPVGVLVWKWASLWQDTPDMRILGPMAVTCAGTGAFAFWRKHKALLQLPPDLEWARQLAGDAKRETIVQTLDKRDPDKTVLTTVKETELLKPEPSAPDDPK